MNEASRLYGFDARAVSEIPAHEGGRNLTCHTGDRRILRVSTLRDRTHEDYLAETEYVHYLALGGASVADVFPSVNGEFVEIIKWDGEECAVSVFETAKGDRIAAHGYRYRDGAPIEEYRYNCGRTPGRLHALSMDYQPVHRRFDFF